MKTLILARHAKSDWSLPGQKDFDRTLNSRGTRVAPKMGHKLAELGVNVDVIVSSPAERAKLTAQYIAEQLKYDTDNIDFNQEIYEASIRSLLVVVNQLQDEYSSAMLVGHNPSFTYLAEYLTSREIGNVPTAGIVKINFALNSWAEVSQNTGDLEWFIYPKMFEY